MLYGRLDELRAETSARLTDVLAQGASGTHQARFERDALAALYTERLAQVNAVESGLCFGRLDLAGGERRYIGRLSLLDEDDDYEPLLVDWRAPASRPFYCATAATPESVVRRRHLRTRGRTVTELDDEVLDLAAIAGGDERHLNGETALLAALNASRTGRMTDIVATIQAEQDRVIRSELGGVLVVQGGPGTGKTAVALHRAAYLLYTHRERLAKSGVLVLGPNATFLRYIDQVLPSLGESGVLLRTIAELYPGVRATGWEPAQAAELKGRLCMVDVLAAAVRDRQRLPDDALRLTFDGETIRVDRRLCAAARERARDTRLPHNLARRVFVREMLDVAARLVAARSGDYLPGDEVADIRAELRADVPVREALDSLWPALGPQQLLADLFSSQSRLAAAAPRLGLVERALLLRRRRGYQGWTPADVPLLDEAAELLGVDDDEREARAAAARREEVDYARGVLQILDLDDAADPEQLQAVDLLDSERLADRAGRRSHLTTAERAAADRTWTFGHVIVDEAQELSPMAWRMVLRRCPTRSMTVVGDVAQTSSPAGLTHWGQALDGQFSTRWRLAELTVNYRTPAEIMMIAAEVLTSVDPSLEPPTSVRANGTEPWTWRAASSAELAAKLPSLVAHESALAGDGRLAVLSPAAMVGEVGRLVLTSVRGAAIGGNPGALDAPVLVLTVVQAKGLEFDSVLLIEPALILDESARGGSDLYVALTRATQRLGVVHTGELPAVLSRLRPQS